MLTPHLCRPEGKSSLGRSLRPQSCCGGHATWQRAQVPVGVSQALSMWLTDPLHTDIGAKMAWTHADCQASLVSALLGPLLQAPLQAS